MESETPTFLDFSQASLLGEWFASSGAVFLSYEVLFNLLTCGPVACSLSDFTLFASRDDPQMLRIRHRAELEALIAEGKLTLVDRGPYGETSLGRDPQFVAALDLARVARDAEVTSMRARGAKSSDLENLAYCAAKGLPLLASKHGLAHLEHLAALAREPLDLLTRGRDVVGGAQHSAEVLRFIFNVEVPRLILNTKESVEAQLAAFRTTLSDEAQWPAAEAYLRAQLFDERVAITPEEFLRLLRDENALTALREFIARLRASDLTQDDVNDVLKSEWDKLLGRLEVSEWVFTGLNVATSPLPFSGAITAPLQVGVNRLLRGPSRWLLYLNEFNKMLRADR